MRSSHGEIEVFLCPDDPPPRSAQSSPDSTTSPQSTSRHSGKVVSLPPEMVCTSETTVKKELIFPDKPKHSAFEEPDSTEAAAGMHDALLSESDDFCPMGGVKFPLQAEDQNSMLGKERIFGPSDTLDVGMRGPVPGGTLAVTCALLLDSHITDRVLVRRWAKATLRWRYGCRTRNSSKGLNV